MLATELGGVAVLADDLVAIGDLLTLEMKDRHRERRCIGDRGDRVAQYAAEAARVRRRGEPAAHLFDDHLARARPLQHRRLSRSRRRGHRRTATRDVTLSLLDPRRLTLRARRLPLAPFEWRPLPLLLLETRGRRRDRGDRGRLARDR